MRATISFEAQVDRVNDMMCALAKKEGDVLRSSAHLIETAEPHQITERLSEALGGIFQVTRQLEQYRDMLISFEQARFSTLVPQQVDESRPGVRNVEEAQQTMESMKKFGNFIESINHQEEENGSSAKEG